MRQRPGVYVMSTNSELLYKFMPIGPYFRHNLVMLLQNQAPFFARRQYLNDPVDCTPAISAEMDDSEILECVATAMELVHANTPLGVELQQLNQAMEANRKAGGFLDQPHFRGLLGISPASKPKSLIGSEGTPLRAIAKDILLTVSKTLIAEPLIYSLSETCTEQLLWAHYAAGHTGICIALSGLKDYRGKLLKEEVEYSNHRPTVTIAEILRMNQMTKAARDTLRHIFFKKSSNWDKEKEFRLVARQTRSAYVHAELAFPEGSYIRMKGIEIKEIILGSSCREQELIVDGLSPSVRWIPNDDLAQFVYEHQILAVAGDAKVSTEGI